MEVPSSILIHKHNLMEKGPSWEANGCLAIQEFPALYRTWRVITMPKSLPLTPVLNHMNTIYTYTFYFFKIQFNILIHN